MRILILLLSFALMTGCAVQLEMGAGKNDRLLGPVYQEWIDHGGVGAYLGVRAERRLSDRVDGMCYYKHFSQYDVGKPFDDRREDTLDAYGCGVSIRILGERQ